MFEKFPLLTAGELFRSCHHFFSRSEVSTKVGNHKSNSPPTTAKVINNEQRIDGFRFRFRLASVWLQSYQGLFQTLFLPHHITNYVYRGSVVIVRKQIMSFQKKYPIRELLSPT